MLCMLEFNLFISWSASDEETGTAGIVDGQHRVGALLLMMRVSREPMLLVCCLSS